MFQVLGHVHPFQDGGRHSIQIVSLVPFYISSVGFIFTLFVEPLNPVFGRSLSFAKMNFPTTTFPKGMSTEKWTTNV